MDEGLSDPDPLSLQYSSDGLHGGYSGDSHPRKRVTFYDPEEDALALAAALKHTYPESGPIIKVLPRLSDENVLELRTEYKKHIKVSGRGINVAKHIKMKVPGNLGKIAYAVALGRWESEAYWANFWYQSNSSRRELLIESLMGRTNSDIAKIKDAFRDKRYNDSLEKCMQTELKKDKFRNAVLLALEEKRMDETEKLSIDRVQRDVQELHRALTAKEGGETAMINIIVVRNDNHLREVLRVFEGKYRKNFAREMIQKSRNLVVSAPPLSPSSDL
jgi:translation elongation factor EF-G